MDAPKSAAGSRLGEGGWVKSEGDDINKRLAPSAGLKRNMVVVGERLLSHCAAGGTVSDSKEEKVALTTKLKDQPVFCSHLL